MQRPPSAQFYPITVENLDFIDSALVHCTLDYDSDLQTFAARLKGYLTHPSEIGIGELCSFLPQLRNADRMRLLNMRPTLLADVYDLVVLLRNIDNPEERLLIACSQIERLFHHNTETMGNNLILLASTLQQTKQLMFCKFAMGTMLKKMAHERLTNSNWPEDYHLENDLLSTSFLFSLLGCASYFTRSEPAITIVAFLGAIAFAARSVEHRYQAKRLKSELWHTYSIWKQSITKPNLDLTKKNSHNRPDSPTL